MVTLRRSSERGYAQRGWLKSYFTFSFSDYYDPRFMGFRALRVINEDWVAPGTGFPTHGHRNMEILTYIFEGELEHRDSMGNGSVIRPGDVQRMSAGRGVLHSEANPSPAEPVHLLQIWIEPEKEGGPPSYEQKHFGPEEKRGRLRLLASRDGAEGSVRIQQDTKLYSTLLEAGQEIHHPISRGRHAWIQIARGRAEVNGTALGPGDAAAISEERDLILRGLPAEDATATEILVFDLA